VTAEEIRCVGVVGGGQMGCGIAQVAATAGLDVVILDARAELAERAVASIGGQLDKLVDKGKLAASEREALKGRLRPAARVEDLAVVDLAIEAVSEQLALKQAILGDLDRVCRSEAILCSNTSSISITTLAAATRRPAQVMGMHFMNPVPLMALCELVRGLQTSDATFALVSALARRLGKETIVARDVPGFIVNRVLMPLINEACFALYEGLGTAEDIDKGAKVGLNHPMGPLALADLIGLDTTLLLLEVLHAGLGEDKYRPCPLLRQHVAAGWLGRKSGRGFFSYG
jgi:3-hydroxybutyryl-CoA dehydrogenase